MIDLAADFTPFKTVLFFSFGDAKKNEHGNTNVVDGFRPSEKYESQLGLLFPIYGK